MKYKVITSFVGLLLFFGANSQQNSIDARSIVRRFMSTYDIHKLGYPHRVEFEKRKENWYIKTIGFDENQPVRSKPVLFYDGKKRIFLPLNMETGISDGRPEEIMPENESYNFDLQPYYGYNGWYKDVIKEYGKLSSLTETQLYALARAYSSYATESVTGQGGYAAPEDIYKLYFKPNAFSEGQLQKFNTLIDSSIEKYRQLSIRNPNFETRVGDSRDKYANEVMFKFHMLLTFSEKAAKEMLIPKGLFKDSTLKVARAYLNACPQQSIFMSYGDNDFYPLFYVQHVEGLRKDVYVLNYSLIGIDKFIYRMTLPQFDAHPVKITADTTMYAGTNNELIYIQDSASGISATELIRYLRTEGDEYGRKILDINTIELPIKRAGKYNTTARVRLEDIFYLLKNHWILIDMINNLNGRVICFPDKLSDELKNLSDYLTYKKEGPLFLYNN